MMVPLLVLQIVLVLKKPVMFLPRLVSGTKLMTTMMKAKVKVTRIFPR